MQLVDQAMPEPTAEAVAAAMRQGQANAWRVGLTGIHDFDGRRSFTALQLLKERGQLSLRVGKQIKVQQLPESIALGLRSGFGDDWLRIGHIRLFLDCALGPRTELLMQPYYGEADD